MLRAVVTDSSTNNTDNNVSPSPPTSQPSKTPPPHPAFTQRGGPGDACESDDEMGEIIEDDGNCSPERGDGSSSPNSSGLQAKRKKKTRTVFSRAQVFQLESTFDLKR